MDNMGKIVATLRVDTSQGTVRSTAWLDVRVASLLSFPPLPRRFGLFRCEARSGAGIKLQPLCRAPTWKPRWVDRGPNHPMSLYNQLAFDLRRFLKPLVVSLRKRICIIEDCKQLWVIFAPVPC